jgi:hypothetical protein
MPAVKKRKVKEYGFTGQFTILNKILYFTAEKAESRGLMETRGQNILVIIGFCYIMEK